MLGANGLVDAFDLRFFGWRPAAIVVLLIVHAATQSTPRHMIANMTGDALSAMYGPIVRAVLIVSVGAGHAEIRADRGGPLAPSLSLAHPRGIL